MGEPLVAASEHTKIALLESADIWPEVSEDVFSSQISICF